MIGSMATALRVPRQYEGGLAKLRGLDDEPAKELLAALQKIPPSTFSAASISSAVAATVDTVAASDVEEIVPVLLHFYAIKDARQLSASDVAEGIVRGMEETASKQLRLSPEERDPFESRLGPV